LMPAKYFSRSSILLFTCMLTTWIILCFSCQFGNKAAILWTANWSADNSLLAVGGSNNEVLLFETTDFTLIKSYPLDFGVLRMDWHPSKNMLAVAADGSGSCIIDVEKDKIFELKGISEGSRAIAWNRSGKYLASASYDKSLSIWNPSGSIITHVKEAAAKSFVGIDWHPSKDEIITLSDSIRIFDFQGNVLQTLDHRKEEVLMLSVEWHPSGDLYAIGDYGDHDFKYAPLLQFWNKEGTLRLEVEESKAEYRNLSWSHDGARLATASDMLRIWSRDGKLLSESGPSDLLWGVDWSSNGEFIATSSIEGHIKIWNRNAKFVRELNY
ncbi:MAG: hypothetical protein OEQ53_16695, partial [Saprospiraceae bacterium]|nr:hypothetical protein [Saprospiraceae bacterium]